MKKFWIVCLIAAAGLAWTPQSFSMSETPQPAPQKRAVQKAPAQKAKPSAWQKLTIRLKALLPQKRIYWRTVVHEELEALWLRSDIWPIPSLGDHSACQIDPLRERLIENYAGQFLAGNFNEADYYLGRFAYYLRCIGQGGMIAWEQFFDNVHRRALALPVAERTEALRGTFNPALLVADYFLHTGFSKLQRTVARNLSAFEAALGISGANHLLVLDHERSALFSFQSSEGDPILLNAARTFANLNGELGLGLCPVSEMASAGFQGICDRGFDELFDRAACAQGGGGEPVGGGGGGEMIGEPGHSGSMQGSGGGGGGTLQGSGGGDGSSISGGSGPGSALSDPGSGNVSVPGSEDTSTLGSIHGVSETQLRMMECGLGGPGLGGGNSMPGLAGTLFPAGGCFRAAVGLMMASRTGGEIMQCVDRYGQGDVFQASDEEMPIANQEQCWAAAGAGRVDNRYATRYEYTENIPIITRDPNANQTITLRVEIKVDDRENFQRTVFATAPTGTAAAAVNTRETGTVPVEQEGAVIGVVSQGNLNDQTPEARETWRAMDRADDRGTVSPPRNCSAGEASCNQQRVQQSRFNERLRNMEQERREGERRRAAGASQPGPEAGGDDCTAESRRFREQAECMFGDESGEEQFAESRGPGHETQEDPNSPQTGADDSRFAALDCHIQEPETVRRGDENVDQCPRGDMNCRAREMGPVNEEMLRELHRIDPSPIEGGQGTGGARQPPGGVDPQGDR